MARGDFERGAGPLHAHRADQHLHPRRAPAQNVEHVLDGRAARGSDDPDAAREFRQGAFAGRLKKSFCFQFAFERFEFRLQKAEPARLQDLHAELILPARFEDGDVAVNLHLHAVGERSGEGRERVAKDHAGDRGALVFEGEILVTGRVLLVVGDFPLHPDRTELRLEQIRGSSGSARRP